MIVDACSRRRAARSAVAVLAVACSVAVSLPLRAENYVAGVTPDRRPEQAPVVTTFEKSPAWLRAATKGVSDPRLPGFKFIEDQGAWYTPFTRPGMVGRYDIRGLHGVR